MTTLDTKFLELTTREKYLPVLKNNIFSKTRLMKILMMKGRKKDWTGRSLLWNVVAKRHHSHGLFKGYSEIPNQPSNPLVSASLSNANYVATVSLSLEEEKLNTGNMEKLLDILKTQMQNAEETLREQWAIDAYGDGTPRGGFEVLQGLKKVVATNNTYATIDRTKAENAFWRANVNSSAYTDAQLQDKAHAGYLPGLMYKAYTDATHNDSPDIVVTTKRLYNIYQLIAQTSNLRFNNEVANLGFGGVEFGPGVTMIFDDYCTAKHMYFLTLSDWTVFAIPGADFDFDEDNGSIWKKPTGQLAKLAHLIWMGQLRCDAPRQQSALTALGD